MLERATPDLCRAAQIYNTPSATLKWVPYPLSLLERSQYILNAQGLFCLPFLSLIHSEVTDGFLTEKRKIPNKNVTEKQTRQ